MGMTNRQFQGVIRVTLVQIGKVLEISPDNRELLALKKYIRLC